MLPNGSFLVCGGEAVPTVHILTEEQMQSFYHRCNLAERATKPVQARAQVFGLMFNQPTAMYAVPAWSEEAMEMLASHYNGQYQTEVRGIAAAIRLGRPFSKDGESPKSDDNGGEKIPKPKVPKGKGPSALQKLMTS